MAIGKIIGAQRDFSAGELDISVKRADENPIMKSGARQMSNLRILASGAAQNRPGRTAIGIETGRVERIQMAAGQRFYLVFGNGYLRVYDASFTQRFTSTVLGDGVTAIPFTTATLGQITYAIIGLSIYIAYAQGAPANVPQVLTWDGTGQTGAWTLSTYAETIGAGGQKRTLFYRISPPNITIQPSATAGSVTLTASVALFVNGQIGTRIRYCGRQILITAVGSSTSATGLVIEPLPPSQSLTITNTVGAFNIGDEVKGSITGASAIVTSAPNTQQILIHVNSGSPAIGQAITGGTSGATGIITSVGVIGGGNYLISVSLSTSTLFQNSETITATGLNATITRNPTTASLIVQLLETNGFAPAFTTSDLIVGPSGQAGISAQSVGAPQAVAVWDDEVMNAFRGYPSSIFFDQDRLGLCNIPSVPRGIAWSAIALPTDLYVGALPDNAIFELVPGPFVVQYVVPGMENSEFVFCDSAVIYIPIDVNNPLVPGSVTFKQLSSFGSHANVQPRRAEQTIVFAKSGAIEMAAVQAPGAYYRPYVIDHISEMHSHLFTASPIMSIAAPSATNQFEEHYIYTALANGTVVVGRYQIRQGIIEPGVDGKPKVGWVPWSGGGTVTWVGAIFSEVDFTTSYAPNAVPAVSIVEKLDNTQYLDGALFVNALPAPFTPPGGKGPLYEFPGPNSTVFLIDLSGSSSATVFGRPMGIYNVDANGFIIPQNIDGENLSSASLVAGQPWTATLEPFVPDAQPGPSQHQRMFKRRVARMAIYVSSSSGFLMARLFSGPLTPTSPALGTTMNTRRVTAYNQGDDPTQPPPLREEAERWRPLGRAYDPRVAVIKDLPGPLLVHEIGIESSI